MSRYTVYRDNNQKKSHWAKRILRIQKMSNYYEIGKD